MTRIRIQGALEVGDDGVARASCYWCRAPVELPLRLTGGPADEEQFLLQEPRKP